MASPRKRGRPKGSGKKATSQKKTTEDANAGNVSKAKASSSRKRLRIESSEDEEEVQVVAVAETSRPKPRVARQIRQKKAQAKRAEEQAQHKIEVANARADMDGALIKFAIQVAKRHAAELQEQGLDIVQDEDNSEADLPESAYRGDGAYGEPAPMFTNGSVSTGLLSGAEGQAGGDYEMGDVIPPDDSGFLEALMHVGSPGSYDFDFGEFAPEDSALGGNTDVDDFLEGRSLGFDGSQYLGPSGPAAQLPASHELNSMATTLQNATAVCGTLDTGLMAGTYGTTATAISGKLGEASSVLGTKRSGKFRPAGSGGVGLGSKNGGEAVQGAPAPMELDRGEPVAMNLARGNADDVQKPPKGNAFSTAWDRLTLTDNPWQ